MIKNLKDHKSAHAYVRIGDDGRITLVSYWTEVIRIDANGWIECTGTYSATTIRHIGWFMKEYTNKDYYFAKELFEKGIRYNLKTGEVEVL